ncbi:UDP-Glycosyltransferase/glycogen phosphorylase [Trametes gibbosa]|nr:UDP-Glycosyltransferase/glycogen phosphorylase [Trametes gibbosa]
MTVTEEKHLVVFSSQFWGHARPLSTFVARLVKLRPVCVTFLALESFHSRVEAEVGRGFQPDEECIASKIRIISLKEGTEPHETSGAPGAFKEAWKKLCNDEPLICAKTSVQFDSLPVRPSAALLDFFAVDAYEAIREVSGSALKVYAWYASAMLSFFQILGQDPLDMLNAEAARTGRTFEDVAHEMFSTFSGRLVESPCIPTLHDYEMHPQEEVHKSRGDEDAEQVNGLVTFDAANYYPHATTAIRQWFENSSQKVFFAGPLLPSGEQVVANEKTLSRDRGDIVAFLDDKLDSHGEKSTLYISFGSLFWPCDPAKIWAVLDVIMEKNVPFIMSHGTRYAGPIPNDIKGKVAAYNNAIMSDWVPQQALLEHPAIGWFLTHGGHNGTLEAIMAGVPMIVWPISGDQPMNAIYLSEQAKIAYELIEVRHGIGLGKIYRNGYTPVGTIDAVKEEVRGVLDQAFGADGAEKRARLQALRHTLQAAWGEDGVARHETIAFFDEI